MLCGGSDSVIIPTGIISFIIIYIDLASYLWLSHVFVAGVGGFIACRALSQRNNDPTRAF